MFNLDDALRMKLCENQQATFLTRLMELWLFPIKSQNKIYYGKNICQR